MQAAAGPAGPCTSSGCSAGRLRPSRPPGLCSGTTGSWCPGSRPAAAASGAAGRRRGRSWSYAVHHHVHAVGDRGIGAWRASCRERLVDEPDLGSVRRTTSPRPPADRRVPACSSPSRVGVQRPGVAVVDDVGHPDAAVQRPRRRSPTPAGWRSTTSGRPGRCVVQPPDRRSSRAATARSRPRGRPAGHAARPQLPHVAAQHPQRRPVPQVGVLGAASRTAPGSPSPGGRSQPPGPGRCR